MSNSFSKEDLPFLVEAMDRKVETYRFMNLAAAEGVGANDKVTGDMSIPKPLTVDVNGTMSTDDYKACAMMMTVCQNMVQKSITGAAKTAGIPAVDALKNMQAWVQGYVDFPFPFFNFKDTQSEEYRKQ